MVKEIKAKALVWCILSYVAASTEPLVAELLSRNKPNQIFKPLCPSEVGTRCQYKDYSHDQYFYDVNGRHQTFKFMVQNYFNLPCVTTLDDTALPQFPSNANFSRVMLEHCAPPSPPATYITALQRLNVTVLEKLILNSLPEGTRITRAMLADLPRTVNTLEICAASGVAPLLLDSDSLEGFDHLRVLKLRRVKPGRLPPNLTYLEIRNSGLRRLPEPLDHLEYLDVSQNEPLVVASLKTLTRLKSLSIAVPLSTVPVLPPRLVNVFLRSIDERSLARFQQCAELETLSLPFGKLVQLPTEWVAACPVLHTLTVQAQPNLTELPSGLLRNATNLRVLNVISCSLKTLPMDLFEDTLLLTEVNLSGNKLESLPDGLFTRVTRSLKTLNLSNNRLLSANACVAVQSLTSLSTLSLSYNLLGDFCPQPDADRYSNGMSCLKFLINLEWLSLSNVGAPRVCTDWLRDMHSLRRLDLTDNNVTTLMLSDLNKLKRNQQSVLDLTGNNITALGASKEDYFAIFNEQSFSQVTVLLDSKIVCNCTAYWFYRYLNERGPTVIIKPVCSDPSNPNGVYLMNIDPARLECTVECPSPCHCRSAPIQDDLGLIATCDAVPPAALFSNSSQRLKKLHLDGVGLSALPVDLPKDLLFLDLDNNSISRASAIEGTALFKSALRVRLTRNPLSCDCKPDSFLSLLYAHQGQLVDLNETLCADGRSVSDAIYDIDTACVARTGAGGGVHTLGAGVVVGTLMVLLAIVVAVVALTVTMARAELRLRLKAWLHARGIRGRWVSRKGDSEDDKRRYMFDVFVSCAMQDERFVAEKIVQVLEKQGYRLCLKYRDWPPGAWIPDQIEQSVFHSRRTLCVVSSHWASAEKGSREGAEWAGAELREAHAASIRERRPRLIILLLAPLPPDLASIARSHLVLHWDKPGVWDRLLYALPDPPSPKPQKPSNIFTTDPVPIKWGSLGGSKAIFDKITT